MIEIYVDARADFGDLRINFMMAENDWIIFNLLFIMSFL
jgi:hypothetical protein